MIIIKPERVIQWMNVIRNTILDKNTQYRILENFWASQINSKVWMLNSINEYLDIRGGVVYILGGWYGLASQLIVDNIPNVTSVSIDVDPNCEHHGRNLSNNDSRIVFLTDNMVNYINYKDASLIINTSTEHITQEDYDEWFKNLPTNVPIIIQGNNFFSIDEHIRCSDTLDQFNEINQMSKVLYTDEYDCNEFKRFMTIGYK